MARSPENPLVGVVMGSVSDSDVAQKGIDVLNQFEIPHEVGIKSAHRTPDRMSEYAKTLGSRGVRAVIAVAGGSAHLPGMIASETSVPVLAVPVRRVERGHGDEARKSSIAMPPGIPLAVFPDNAADRAALYTVRMLATTDEELRERYEASQSKMHDDVAAQDERIHEIGWDEFQAELATANENPHYSNGGKS